MSTGNMENTRFSNQLRLLHGSLLDIVAMMNRPQQDEKLLEAAGLSLERALLPVLISIAKRGPLGVVELSEGIGRDYTTLSRQVARLEQLDLIKRRVSARDRRVREAVVTDKGKVITDRIDKAREQMARTILADWDDADLDQLVVLIQRFADAMKAAEALAPEGRRP